MNIDSIELLPPPLPLLPVLLLLLLPSLYT
jgi:hypothetical protein